MNDQNGHRKGTARGGVEHDLERSDKIGETLLKVGETLLKVGETVLKIGQTFLNS
jgi:hypothetical protein